ncbi:MAG: hypothetical protein ACTHJT_13370 [Cytophaga sp.]|uniref:hypothetical protein n=1 Tax=Cytophaga sp. TaxID=29535 RepID=UPI003F7E89B4
MLLFIAVMLDFITNSCIRSETAAQQKQCPVAVTNATDTIGFNKFDNLSQVNTCIKKNNIQCISSSTYSTCNTITRNQLDSLLHVLEYNNNISKAILISPLEKTQTVIACNKQGKAIQTFKVISDRNGNIEFITFSDRKNKVEYNIKDGITKSQSKKLRKDFKHLVESGQVFYYDEKQLTSTDKIAHATSLP